MRKYYQRRLPSDPSRDYYFIHRLTGNTQPVLIEYGFIDNANDLRKLQSNLLTYGEAVVRAVAEYTNTPYISSGGIETNVYVVQRGDTLYSIANKLNITVAELKAANNLTSNLLNIGQRLIIPSTIPPTVQPNDYVTYEVQRGDTLYSIAREFNTTVNELININQLSSTNLSIGQKLLIPTTINNPEGSTNYYTVQRGDSLYSIANKFGVTVDEIISANNLTTTVLQIGDQLMIPGYTEEEEMPIIPPTDTLRYTVKSGDSLYSIAKRFNTTVNTIKELNNLSSNLLTIGQELLIPSNSENIVYYVKSGDNLYDIARRYNTTVSEIKRLNNLTSDLLSIGQILQLPA